MVSEALRPWLSHEEGLPVGVDGVTLRPVATDAREIRVAPAEEVLLTAFRGI